jgi:nucleoside-diphosphate-sugar epimerase
MNWRNKEVLVTGGAGFIGSHLVKKLVIEGAHVNILLKKGESRWRIQDILEHLTLWEADLADAASLQSIQSHITPQIIFHLAAQVDSLQSWDIIHSMIQDNIVGTINLLTVLRDSGFERFVHVSSSEEYGAAPAPLSELQRESPISPYSFTKLSSTIFCQMAAKTFGLPITILRLFPTYGPLQKGSMLIPSAIHDLLKKKEFRMTAGEQSRDFIYVDDVVEAFLLIAMAKNIDGEVFNVGSGKPRKVKEVIELIKQYIGDDAIVMRGAIPCRAGEGNECYCDNSKIRRLTNWAPRVPLEEGLRMTVAWYKNFFAKN